MANLSDYSIIEVSGEYVVAVPTQIDGNPTTWSSYYYLFENPVTLEEDIIDEETGQVIGTQYVPSKLEMRIENIQFLVSGGNRVVQAVNGNPHWLIKMPNDFLIDSGYQPNVDKPKAEDWNIGGAYGDNKIFPFIPQRATEYGDVSDIFTGLIVNTWNETVAILLNQKY